MMSRPSSDRATLTDTIIRLAHKKGPPFFVAIDGRSGVGKSTLARTLGERLNAAVIEGDDFFAGGVELRTDSATSRVAACIDWARQRTVLETLAIGRVARWQAFDWDVFDGRLCEKLTQIEPRPLVILEGVYSARTELSDMFDLRVLVSVPEELRLARLTAREGTVGPWERQWHEAEEVYFRDMMPPKSFDLVIGA